MYPKVTYFYTAGHTYAPFPWVFNDTPKTNRIYYIYSGNAYFTINGIEYRLKAGYLYFFPYTLEFIAHNDENNRLLHTFFDFEMLPPVINDHFIEIYVEENLLLYHSLKALESLIFKIPLFDKVIIGNEYEKLLPSGIAELLIPLLENLIAVICTETNTKFVSDPVILNALSVIHRDYAQKITVKKLALQACLDTDYFIRRFKLCTYTTPYAYLRDLRLRTAITLRRNGLTMEETAYCVGFSNASSLSHAIKTMTG